MADTKKLKKTVGKSAVRNTIQISAGDRIYYAIVDVLLGVFTIIVLMPLLNVLASSFSSPEAVNYGWVLFWPVDFSLEGYEAVFEYKGLWQAYGNTFFYAIVGTAEHHHDHGVRLPDGAQEPARPQVDHVAVHVHDVLRRRHDPELRSGS